MNACPECTDPAFFEQFVLGKLALSELQTFGEHLATCDSCQRHIEAIATEDSLVRALGMPPVGVLTDDSELSEAMRRAKLIRSTVSPASEGTVLEGRPADATSDSVFTPQLPEEITFLSPPEQPGELGRLGGYRVLELLGIGGMGIVLRAEDIRLKRFVAMKVMKPEVAARASARDRFLREAQCTAAIEHDNIVPIYQVGEDRGVPFIAMPLLRGETLKTRLERTGRLSELDVVRLGKEIAFGLAAAHERGLIHRDIKPDNIWLEAKSNRGKILDFGLVRAVTDDAGLTQSGVIMGTPRYMAPEQARGEEVDARSDLFSLGSVLFHALTGQLAFDGPNITATLLAVTTCEPPDLSKLMPGLHPETVFLFQRLLSKDRKKRPVTANEVAELLADIQSDLERAIVTPRAQSSLADTVATPVSLVTTPLPAGAGGNGISRPRNRIRLAAGGAAFFVLLAIIITITNRDGSQSTITLPDGVPFAVDTAPGVQVSVASSNSEAPAPTASPQPQRSSWHGWPADAPPPAIAPFDAEQAQAHQEAWAKYLGLPVEYTNSIGMKFRLIPPGEFLMGATEEEVTEAVSDNVSAISASFYRSSGPQHRVVLTQPYYLGTCEVTQGEYQQVRGENPSVFAIGGAEASRVPGRDTTRYPVDSVSWERASHFCVLLRERWYSVQKNAREPAPLDYRLPTEAEWEFATRAGTTTRYWSGDSHDDLLQAAWHGANSDGHTHPVATRLPNRFGLYDVHGNVSEWVRDAWDEQYYQNLCGITSVNPVGCPLSADAWRVRRGGASYWSAKQSYSSLRFALGSVHALNETGFRVLIPARRGMFNPDQPHNQSENLYARNRRLAEAVQQAGGIVQLDPGWELFGPTRPLPELPFVVRGVQFLRDPKGNLDRLDSHAFDHVQHLYRFSAIDQEDASRFFRSLCLQNSVWILSLESPLFRTSSLLDFSRTSNVLGLMIDANSLDDGWDSLQKLPRLRYLKITGTLPATSPLEQLGRFEHLREVWLVGYNSLPSETIAQIQAANPGLRIILGFRENLQVAGRDPVREAFKCLLANGITVKSFSYDEKLANVALNDTLLSQQIWLQAAFLQIPSNLACTPEVNQCIANIAGTEYISMEFLSNMDADRWAHALAKARLSWSVLAKGSSLSDIGLEFLTHAIDIRILNVIGTRVTEAGLRRFRQIHPTCTILSDFGTWEPDFEAIPDPVLDQLPDLPDFNSDGDEPVSALFREN